MGGLTCDLCGRDIDEVEYSITEPDIDFAEPTVWVLCSWKCFSGMMDELKDEHAWKTAALDESS